MEIAGIGLNGFDIAVLVVVLVSLLMAASRGLFRELISIAALVGASIASLFVWGRFRFAAQDFIQPDQLADLVLGAGTFALSYMLMVFLFSGVTKSLRGKKVGLLDRATGAGFGALRGLVICSLVTMFFTSDFRESMDMNSLTDAQRNSYMQDIIAKEVKANDPNLPQSLRQRYEREAIEDRTALENAGKVELPAMFAESTLFPVVNRISNFIRGLPITRWKTMAERLKEGEKIRSIISNGN